MQLKIAIRKFAGFALVEIAIALIVLALLSAGALTALRVQSQRSHLSDTRNALDDARSAILGYAIAQGKLPCPSTAGDGKESACNPIVATGVVPWFTLGMTQAEAQDAWGRGLRYTVTTAFTTTTLPDGIKLSALGAVNICGSTATCSNTSSTNLNTPGMVAFALWSTGEDPTDAPSGPTGTVVAASNVDDIVIWVSRYVLLYELIEAGRSVPQ